MKKILRPAVEFMTKITLWLYNKVVIEKQRPRDNDNNILAVSPCTPVNGYGNKYRDVSTAYTCKVTFTPMKASHSDDDTFTDEIIIEHGSQIFSKLITDNIEDYSVIVPYDNKTEVAYRSTQIDNRNKPTVSKYCIDGIVIVNGDEVTVSSWYHRPWTTDDYKVENDKRNLQKNQAFYQIKMEDLIKVKQHVYG